MGDNIIRDRNIWRSIKDGPVHAVLYSENYIETFIGEKKDYFFTGYIETILDYYLPNRYYQRERFYLEDDNYYGFMTSEINNDFFTATIRFD